MTKRPEFTTVEPVELNGFQAILKPSQHGFSLAADITDSELIESIKARREELLAEQLNRMDAKKKKRATVKPPTWEEENGVLNVRFSWDSKSRPTVVDALGTVVLDDSIKLYSGSRVRISFDLQGYTLPDCGYGTKLLLKAIQIVEVGEASQRKYSPEEASDIFGTYEGGFKVGDIPPAGGDDDDEEEEEADY